jgi:hypothetical protein
LSEVVTTELLFASAVGLAVAAGLAALPDLRPVATGVLAGGAIAVLMAVDGATALAGLGVLLGLAAGWAPSAPLRVAGAAAGALLTLSTVSEEVSPAARVGLALVAVGAGLAIVDLQDRGGARLPAVLGLLTLGGIWLTVPDTEPVLAVAGVLGPTLLVAAASGGPGSRLLEPAASVMLVAVVLWAVAEGGRGRPGSIVGGVACLGLLVLEPVVRRVGRRSLPPTALVVVHAGVVLVASRGAGLRTDAGAAALIGGAVLIGSAALLLLAGRSTGPA